ncbi:DUF6069 family protein [Natronorubrum halophilum]|uniref:DUF6069 family protein n=1 Tax=Natronorubrum halophilum TaxID=1702106 RepID=UPI001EE817F1|nr:DUF6069 family protein [Natronorubrum halophilum]
MAEVESTSVDARRRSVPVRGGIAVALSVLVNVGLVVAVAALGIAPGFQALTVPPVAFLSALGSIGALAVYWLLGRYTENQDRLFVRIAAVVLVLSFVPDAALLSVDPAATVPGVVVLMIMHVVVAVASVWLLVYWVAR